MGGGPGLRPPQIVFGLWLDRPGHQDGALGHHAGVLDDAPGYLSEIMQDISQFVYVLMIFGSGVKSNLI